VKVKSPKDDSWAPSELGATSAVTIRADNAVAAATPDRTLFATFIMRTP